jgi:hypothetical protein
LETTVLLAEPLETIIRKGLPLVKHKVVTPSVAGTVHGTVAVGERDKEKGRAGSAGSAGDREEDRDPLRAGAIASGNGSPMKPASSSSSSSSSSRWVVHCVMV